MLQRQKRISLLVILFIGFVDYMAIGLVYPVFTYLFFDPQSQLVSIESSIATRGFLLGLLIALQPLAEFFSAPIVGTLSDQKGRKRILVYSLCILLLGYLCAIIGLWIGNLSLLFTYRILVGIGAGSVSVVFAAVADLSLEHEKSRNFGWLNMAFGVGFMVGPFIGGKLSSLPLPGDLKYMPPFIFAFLTCVVNLILILRLLKETHPTGIRRRLNWFEAIEHLKKAYALVELRVLFLVMFVFILGWSFFAEFVPIFLIHRFDYTASDVGDYFAFSGGCFAFASGFLIQPIVKRFSTRNILLFSLLLGGAYLWIFLLIPTPWMIIAFLPILQLFLALVFPTATTVVSNKTDPNAQGEVMGIYSSVIALGFAISPLSSGQIVAENPTLAVWVGGFGIFLAGVIFGLFYWRRAVNH